MNPPFYKILCSRRIHQAALIAACMAFNAYAYGYLQNKSLEADSLGRPWEMRYVLIFKSDSSWRVVREIGPAANEDLKRKGSLLRWEHLATPHTREQWAKPPERDLGAVMLLLQFSRSGALLSGSLPLGGKAYVNRLLEVVLQGDATQAEPGPYWIGYWFTGIGDISTHWAPAICDYQTTPNPFSKDSPSYLYGPKFSAHEYQGTFGCREWAYQLYDPDRPYIDVTSYMPRRVKSEYRTYIRDFIGWARFGDKKPVIGRHGAEWYCLFDCPNDEPPGNIPDIKIWAAKNGWPIPKPPTRSPTFPDPPLKQGTYP